MSRENLGLLSSKAYYPGGLLTDVYCISETGTSENLCIDLYPLDLRFACFPPGPDPCSRKWNPDSAPDSASRRICWPFRTEDSPFATGIPEFKCSTNPEPFSCESGLPRIMGTLTTAWVWPPTAEERSSLWWKRPQRS